MAVIQISKIQLRRGKKNSEVGIPQLSSAELAWAIDSQELYIGNGSLTEGAPFVGNTKILTEHDNILELAGSYQFAVDNPLIVHSVPRSLQSKVDEIAVSVKDFGAVGDGIVDDTQAFKNAADQLFKNAGAELKKILMVPNGEYMILSNLELPGTTILKGETQEGSIINIGSSIVSFVSEDGQPITSSNQPSSVLIENLTVKRSTGTVNITNLYNSDFSKVRFVSNYELSNDILDILEQTASVSWTNELFGTRTTDIRFKECRFENQTLAALSRQTDVYSTEIFFQNCTFENCYSGVVIIGINGQRNDWIFDACHFKSIATRAIDSFNGGGTVIQQAVFRNVGNGIYSPETPITPMVEFGEYLGNEIISSSSDRLSYAELTNDNTKLPIPVSINASKAEFIDAVHSTIDLTDNLRAMAVFSVLLKSFKIEYILRLGVGIRKGTLMISVDGDLSHVSISDNFTYSSSSSTSPGGVLMTDFEFGVELKDNDGNSEFDTIVLSYRNPINHRLPDSTEVPGETGDITFSICYGV